MKNYVSLRHLRCFIALAESGSFTVAASRLFMTQSSLTAIIQQFEEVIGFKLFDRTTRRVVMTQEAAQFKERAERIVKEFDNSVRDLKAVGKAEHGHIRIAAAASVIDQILVRVISKFRSTHPKVTISLRDAGAEQVEQMVLDGAVDFAIDSRHKTYEDLSYVPLLKDSYGVVCHPDYWIAGAPEPLRWKDLTSEGFVAFTADTGIRKFLANRDLTHFLFSAPHDEVSSTRSLHALLSSGNRYSILPALAVRATEESKLMFMELSEPRLSREICLITPCSRSLSPSAGRFINVLATTLQQDELPHGVFAISE